MEDKLVEQLKQMKDKNTMPLGKDLEYFCRQQAKILCSKDCFTASKGWYEKFKKRL